MKTKILLLFLLLIGFANAQENIKNPETKNYNFTLEQAIAHALTNNYSAINASRDIEASKQRKKETTAMGLPQINAGIDYSNAFELQKSVVPAEFFGGNPGEFAAVAFGVKQSALARVTLSQLIFDGSYIVALQASKTYLKFYQNAKIKTDIEIREAVINAYGNVLLAQESINIIQKNKTTLEKLLSDTKAIYQNGLIEEENVEQLQITLTSLNSTLNYNKRLVEVANKMLKITLGIAIDSDLKLMDSLDNLTVSNIDISNIAKDFNVNSNINYQMAMNFKEQRELELKLQKSKALPSLGANLNFGYTAFNNTFGFFSADQIYYNYSNLGVGLNVPIFSSFARKAKTQQAKIALQQANTQLTEAEQKLKLQFAATKSDYEFSIEEYATAKSNLKLAERIEKKQQIKFSEGLSSSFDYNEAQRQLYAGQQKYLQSMIDVINKKAALEKISK